MISEISQFQLLRGGYFCLFIRISLSFALPLLKFFIRRLPRDKIVNDMPYRHLGAPSNSALYLKVFVLLTLFSLCALWLPANYARKLGVYYRAFSIGLQADLFVLRNGHQRAFKAARIDIPLLLQNRYKELAACLPFSKITSADICEVCGISRTTSEARLQSY